MTKRLVALLFAGLAIYACELAAKIDRSKIPTEQTVASVGGSGATGGAGPGGSDQGGQGGRMLPMNCTDMRKNGDETDIDCGGSCDPCANGLDCMMATDCVSLFCASLTCGMCTTHADCASAAGTYCDMATGNCVPQKIQGDPCMVVEECGMSLFCVDGFCCDTACDMKCEACNLTGTEGECSCIVNADPEMPEECPGNDVCQGCGDTCAAAN